MILCTGKANKRNISSSERFQHWLTFITWYCTHAMYYSNALQKHNLINNNNTITSLDHCKILMWIRIIYCENIYLSNNIFWTIFLLIKCGQSTLLPPCYDIFMYICIYIIMIHKILTHYIIESIEALVTSRIDAYWSTDSVNWIAIGKRRLTSHTTQQRWISLEA